MSILIKHRPGVKGKQLKLLKTRPHLLPGPSSKILKCNHLVQPNLTQSSIQVGEAANHSPWYKLIVDMPFYGALVAGHQKHPGGFMQLLKPFTHFSSPDEKKGVIHKEKHTYYIRSVPLILKLGNNHFV